MSGYGYTTELVDGDTLVIRIDVSERAVSNAPLSSTGKTYLIASCGAGERISTPAGELRVGFNVTKRAH